MPYTYTTQRSLRRAFWAQHPHLTRRKIPNYSGHGTLHVTATRCAWVEWIDHLARDNQISQALAQRATL